MFTMLMRAGATAHAAPAGDAYTAAPQPLGDWSAVRFDVADELWVQRIRFNAPNADLGPVTCTVDDC
jgi:hypothetical protein